MGLLSVAIETLDSGHFVSFEGVMLFGIHARFELLVVAKTARPEFAIAQGIRTLFHAGSLVVLAP